MKKMILGLLAVAALSLVCAGTTLAAPVGPAGEGILQSLASIATRLVTSLFSVGAGYGITDSVTVGLCSYHRQSTKISEPMPILAWVLLRVNAEVGFLDSDDYNRVGFGLVCLRP